MRSRPSIRRVALLLLAGLFFVARVGTAAAETSLSADFDGDGHRDQVTLDRSDASLLHIWLSSTNATAVVRSMAPIIHVVATDLDGDRRPELIAGSHGGLQVWTKRHHGFRSYKPRPIGPGALRKPGHRRVDDGPTNPVPAVQWSGSSQTALSPVVLPRAPAADLVVAGVAASGDPLASALPDAPFAPRPPPLTF
ncbi:MAG: VCBS repeat-containing protein [Vicinamibacterales bacterium]